MRRWVNSPSYKAALSRMIEARKAAGLTQRDVAKAIGKPPSFIAKIEQGERRLDLVEFIVIARALGVREVDLFKTICADLPKRVDI